MTEVNQKTYISIYFIDIQIEINILLAHFSDNKFKQFYMHDKHCAQNEVQIFDICWHVMSILQQANDLLYQFGQRSHPMNSWEFVWSSSFPHTSHFSISIRLFFVTVWTILLLPPQLPVFYCHLGFLAHVPWFVFHFLTWIQAFSYSTLSSPISAVVGRFGIETCKFLKWNYKLRHIFNSV